MGCKLSISILFWARNAYVKVSNPRTIKDLCDKVLMGELFGFLQVDIHVPDGLLEKFSKFSPLFIVDDVPEDKVPQHMEDYQKRTAERQLEEPRSSLE